MKLISLPIDQLFFDPANARKHGSRNLDAIKASLKKFGQQKPIVVDPNNTVLAGNGTLRAAYELGWAHIQCVRSSLKAGEAMAYAVADNRTAELAEWDLERLAKTLNAVEAESAAGGGAQLWSTGFDRAELAGLVSRLGLGGEEEELPVLATVYRLVITCADAKAQEGLYERLTREGLKVRVQTL
jgi:ParB-like chromosome segregation protein Spo0J